MDFRAKLLRDTESLGVRRVDRRRRSGQEKGGQEKDGQEKGGQKDDEQEQGGQERACVCVCVCVVGARGRLIIFHGGRGPVVGVREARGDAGTTENVADISRGLGMGVTEGRAVGAAEAGGEGRGSVMSRGVDGGEGGGVAAEGPIK